MKKGHYVSEVIVLEVIVYIMFLNPWLLFYLLIVNKKKSSVMNSGVDHQF